MLGITILMIGCIIGISLLVLLQQGSEPNNNNIRRQLLIDPKSVSLRSDIQYSPPPLPQQQEQLDTSLVRSVLNGRSDKSKDALIGMWTMTSLEHRKFAREAVQRINEKKIIGDIVECGKFALYLYAQHILDTLIYSSLH